MAVVMCWKIIKTSLEEIATLYAISFLIFLYMNYKNICINILYIESFEAHSPA